MVTTRYHTRSGSIYDVRSMGPGNPVHVRRARLGEYHVERGPAQVAKRNRDGLDTWRKCQILRCGGVGHPLWIALGPGDLDLLITSPVLSLRALEDEEIL